MKHKFMLSALCVAFIGTSFSTAVFAESTSDESAPTKKSSTKKMERTDRGDEDKIPLEKLTPDERAILARGEIATAPYVVGGALSIFPGLGIGHAVQGRYETRGWIFTVGELGSLGIILAGAASNNGYCYNNGSQGTSCTYTGGGITAIVLGTVGYIGFRVWEIVDAWAIPPMMNREYRFLKERTNYGYHEKVSFNIAPIPMIDMRKDSAQINPGLGLQVSF